MNESRAMTHRAMTHKASALPLRLDCARIALLAIAALVFCASVHAAPTGEPSEPAGGHVEAADLAEHYVAKAVDCERLKAETAFFNGEAKRIELARQAGSPGRVLLEELKVTNPATRQAMLAMLQDNARGVIDALDAGLKDLRQQTTGLTTQWQAARSGVNERQMLLFEIKGSRRMAGHVAWLLSVDNRWFWLCGVVAVGSLLGVVLHDRRHEVRRRLNGGRARAMKLSEFLGGALVVLIVITITTFFMGDRIFESLMAAGSDGEPSPHDAIVEENARIAGEARQLQAARDEAVGKHDALEERWRELLCRSLPEGSTVPRQWSEYRSRILETAVELALLEHLSPLVSADLKRLAALDLELGEHTEATAWLFRLKQWIRTLLGLALVSLTVLGGAMFYRGVQTRTAQMAATCPLCLGVNKLEPIHPPPLSGELAAEPAVEGVDLLRCHNVISRRPFEECDYGFMSAYRRLPKMCFPTLGIPQAGKTHWLAMLYSELNRGNYPSAVQFERVKSHSSGDFDVIVEEILTARIGTAATQRERIPHPLVFNFRDRDRFGRSNLLVNVFDYSGEVTSDMGVEDYRRRRALEADGFFFFLDPTFPSEPQAKALADFREDLRLIRGIKAGKRTRTPVALCLTKIDMLAAQSHALPDGGDAVERFYRELGEIDPTGEGMTMKILRKRSEATARLREVIWPGWQIERQIADLFGGRHMFFPLTPIGLDGRSESDLSARTIEPFGLLEPLVWLLQMNGYPIVE